MNRPRRKVLTAYGESRAILGQPCTPKSAYSIVCAGAIERAYCKICPKWAS